MQLMWNRRGEADQEIYVRSSCAKEGERSQRAQGAAAIISHCITLIRFLIYEAVKQLLLREAFPPSLTFVCLRQSCTLLKQTKAARKV